LGADFLSLKLPLTSFTLDNGAGFVTFPQVCIF